MSTAASSIIPSQTSTSVTYLSSETPARIHSPISEEKVAHFMKWLIPTLSSEMSTSQRILAFHSIMKINNPADEPNVFACVDQDFFKLMARTLGLRLEEITQQTLPQIAHTVFKLCDETTMQDCKTALYYKGIFTNDLTRSCRYLKQAVDMGSTKAMIALGRKYAYARIWPDAFKLFEQAAFKGNAIGQFELGQCYLKGICVTRNARIASQLLKAATEQGHQKASCLLGSMLIRGDEGVQQDVRTGFNLLKAVGEMALYETAAFKKQFAV